MNAEQRTPKSTALGQKTDSRSSKIMDAEQATVESKRATRARALQGFAADAPATSRDFGLSFLLLPFLPTPKIDPSIDCVDQKFYWSVACP